MDNSVRALLRQNNFYSTINVFSVHGDKQLRNEKVCPLQFHTKALVVIPASSICTAVSTVHECSQSLAPFSKVKNKSWTGLQYIHDNSNTCFE